MTGKLDRRDAARAFIAFARVTAGTDLIPGEFGLTQPEFLRYLELGIIKIFGLDDVDMPPPGLQVSIQMGNRILVVAIEDRRVSDHEMRFIRGNNRYRSKSRED